MLKDKKTNIKIKKERLSGFFKETATNFILANLLYAHPEFTLVQCRRVLSYAYQALRSKKSNEVFEKALKQAKFKKEMTETARAQFYLIATKKGKTK